MNVTRLTATCAAAILMAAQAQAGYVYSTKTETTRENAQMSQKTKPVFTTVTVDKDKAKLEIKAGASQPKAANASLMTSDGGKTLYQVNADDKEFIKMEMEKLSAANKERLKEMGVEVKYSGIKVEAITNEVGPEIQGYPTRHIKLRIEYTAVAERQGEKQPGGTVANEVDVWSTEKLADNGFDLEKQQDLRMFLVGDDAVDKLVKGQWEKIKGLALKRKSVTRVLDEKGEEAQKITVEAEVAEIKEQEVPGATFAIPADFKEITVEELMQRAAAGGGMTRPKQPTKRPKAVPPPPDEK